MSEVLETLYAPIDLEIDVAARRARLSVPGLVETRATPIVDPNSGDEFRARSDGGRRCRIDPGWNAG